MSLILKWFIRNRLTPHGWFPYKYAEIQIASIPNDSYWGVWPTWCLQRAALLWAQRQKEKSSLQGVAIWERDIPVHSWPWEIPGMFRSGCEETQVFEKTFLIKCIYLMGGSEALCSILPLQFEPNPLLWSHLGWGSCSGSSVGWRGHFANGPFPVITALPKAICLSQLGNGPWGLQAVGTAHAQCMLSHPSCCLKENNIQQYLAAAPCSEVAFWTPVLVLQR